MSKMLYPCGCAGGCEWGRENIPQCKKGASLWQKYLVASKRFEASGTRKDERKMAEALANYSNHFHSQKHLIRD